MNNNELIITLQVIHRDHDAAVHAIDAHPKE